MTDCPQNDAFSKLRRRKRLRNTKRLYRSVDSLAQDADDIEAEIAFLPFRVRNYLTKKSNFSQPKCLYSSGAVLFIDISGFTKLGRDLKEKNQESVAAEKLAAIIISTLKRLTAICIENKGDVAKFAGDALICVWNCSNELVGIQQAKTAGVQMLNAIRQLDQGLDLHGGITYGTLIDFHLVKKQKKTNRASRWHLLSGCATSMAGELLEQASKGVILCRSSTAVEEITFQTEVAEAFSQVSTNTGSLPPIRALSLTLSRELVTSYVPELVLSKLRGGDAIGGEIVSNVSVIFVSFDALVLTKEELSACKVPSSKVKRLNGAFNKLTKLLKGSGGEIRDLLFDDKGCIFIGVFGAHNVTEESEKKAVIAARRLSRKFKNTRIGISSGACYAGLCGNSLRNDFVVMGHEVNQAARFCNAATTGTILVSRQIRDKTSAFFNFQEHQFEKKGQLFDCFFLKDQKSLTGLEIEKPICIGRSEESSTVLEHMTSSSALVLLKGDKGIGKTTFIYSLREEFERTQDMIYVSGIETEHDTFLFLYKQVLLSLLGLKNLTFKAMKAKCKYLNTSLSLRIGKLLNISRGRKTGRQTGNSSKKIAQNRNMMPRMKLAPKGKAIALNPKARKRAKPTKTNNNSSMNFSVLNSSLNSLASLGIDFLPEKDIKLLSDFLVQVAQASLRKSEKSILLMIFDDFQYCDENSAAIIMRAVEGRFKSKLAFMFSYRSYKSLSHNIRSRVDALEHRLIDTKHILITLQPLKKKDVAPLALHYLQPLVALSSVSKAALSQELVSVLFAHTKGMPNFVQLLVKYYHNNQMLDLQLESQLFSFRAGMYEMAMDNLPKGLSQIASFHLNSLDGIQKRVLKLAACIGVSFSTSRLWKILSKDGVSYSYEEYTLVLRTLIETEFLRHQKRKRFSIIRRPDLRNSKQEPREKEYCQFAWSVYQEAVLSLVPLARQAEIKEFLNDTESLTSAGARSIVSANSSINGFLLE